MRLPIVNCYSVIPERFLAGEYPRNIDEDSSKQKIDALLRHGVGAFIDLTEENEGLHPYAHFIGNASHLRFPIRDVSVPASKEMTVRILDAIDTHLDQGKKVYVHCWGGIGRTGVVVGCWLARHGFKGTAALKKLRELWRQCPKSAWRRSPETIEQEQYIIGWKEP